MKHVNITNIYLIYYRLNSNGLDLTAYLVLV